MVLEPATISYVEYMAVLWYVKVAGMVKFGKTVIYSTYDIVAGSN